MFQITQVELISHLGLLISGLVLVGLATFQIRNISQAKYTLSFMTQFVSSMIGLYALKYVVTNDSIVSIMIYSLGAALGATLGIKLQKLVTK